MSPEAVFAPDDGLGFYRRLLAAIANRLRSNGSLQRRVLAASRARLHELAARL